MSCHDLRLFSQKMSHIIGKKTKFSLMFQLSQIMLIKWESFDKNNHILSLKFLVLLAISQ